MIAWAGREAYNGFCKALSVSGKPEIYMRESKDRTYDTGYCTEEILQSLYGDGAGGRGLDPDVPGRPRAVPVPGREDPLPEAERDH